MRVVVEELRPCSHVVHDAKPPAEPWTLAGFNESLTAGFLVACPVVLRRNFSRTQVWDHAAATEQRSMMHIVLQVTRPTPDIPAALDVSPCGIERSTAGHLCPASDGAQQHGPEGDHRMCKRKACPPRRSTFEPAGQALHGPIKTRRCIFMHRASMVPLPRRCLPTCFSARKA